MHLLSPMAGISARLVPMHVINTGLVLVHIQNLICITITIMAVTPCIVGTWFQWLNI